MSADEDKGRRMGLPARLAATVMLPGLTAAQQRLAWSIVACMALRKPELDGDGQRLVIRIERDAVIDLCAQRIDNFGAELARLMDAKCWAPGHAAHGQPFFELLRYEPGKIGFGIGWVVAQVSEPLKRMLVDPRTCWIPLRQWKETKRQVAVATLVRGTALAWYRDDEEMRPAEGWAIRHADLGMWSERAPKSTWPVWARNTLRPAMKELGHADRIVQFAVAETPGEAIVKCQRIQLKEAQPGYLTDLTLPRVLKWAGVDAGRHPSKAGWRRVYAERSSRKIEAAKIDEREGWVAEQAAEARKMMAEAKRLMAEVERRERALSSKMPPAPRPAESPTAQPTRKAPIVGPSGGRGKFYGR